MSNDEGSISSTEVHALFPKLDLSNFVNTNGSDSGNALCEDLHSRMFYDFDDEKHIRGLWEDFSEEQSRELGNPVSKEELEARAQAQQQGGQHCP